MEGGIVPLQPPPPSTDKTYIEEGLSDWRILLLYTSFISILSDIHHLTNYASVQEMLTLPGFQPFAYISKVSFSSCLKNDDSFTVYLMKNLPLIFAQRPLTFLREERLISSLFQLTPELRGGTLCFEINLQFFLQYFCKLQSIEEIGKM